MSLPVRPMTVSPRALLLTGSLLALGALNGCATPQNPDPLEKWNRKVFAFNDGLDEAVIKPVAKGYKAVTPEPVRHAFTNFVGNILDIWSTINLFLQGRPGDGALGVMRVAVNSTLGLAGLIDIATPMHIDKTSEDFGQTLGVWGVGPGAYIVWPILGPSTLRDTFDYPGVFYFSASLAGTYPRERNVLMGLQFLNMRASLLEAGDLVDDIALDKYAFIRDAYLQRRRSLIYNGDPPDEDAPADPGSGDESAPPAAPASSPSQPAASASAPDGAAALTPPPAASPASPVSPVAPAASPVMSGSGQVLSSRFDGVVLSTD